MPDLDREPTRWFDSFFVNEVTRYRGFNRVPIGADFRLVPEGIIEEIEGAFFCEALDLAQAISELIRYSFNVFDRRDVYIKVWKL